MPARPLSTAVKCLELIDFFASQRAPLRIADVARAIEETPATTYQRLLTLTTAGWLERLEEGTYRLSMRACGIASAALDQAGLGERVLGVMQDLAATTGESCSLVTLQADRIMVAQRVQSRSALRADPEPGAELSFLDSASGRVWLAFGPSGLAERLRQDGVPLPAKDEIDRTRRDGYAVGGGGETLAGVAMAAVPIIGRDRHCMASLSIVSPTTRFDLDRLLPELRAAAEHVVSMQGL